MLHSKWFFTHSLIQPESNTTGLFNTRYVIESGCICVLKYIEIKKNLLLVIEQQVIKRVCQSF